MLVVDLPHRSTASITALIAAYAILPPTLASEPRFEAVAQQPTTSPGAVLRGRVTDQAGAPLADARVRVAIPAVDMRYLDTEYNRGQTRQILETRSDANGDYRVELVGVNEPTTFAIDVLKPGFRRLTGTIMDGGNPRQWVCAPGVTVEAVLSLEPARYYRGVVRNEQGKPVPGVEVAADIKFVRGLAGIERTRTGPDGSFELFDYPIAPFKMGEGVTIGVLGFTHPDYFPLQTEGVDVMEADQRENLEIVLDTGRQVVGTIFDSAGKPVPAALVQVSSADGKRKATKSNAQGQFAILGLDYGSLFLSARALNIKEKVRIPITAEGDQFGLDVRLRPISLPAGVKRSTVLGLQLADLSPDLRLAYDVVIPRGAILLDPGPEADHLRIGDLAESDTFWMVGLTRISSVREFVNQILAEAAGQDEGEIRVRVVYSVIRPELQANRSQYLELSKDDLKQLQIVADQLQAQ